MDVNDENQLQNILKQAEDELNKAGEHSKAGRYDLACVISGQAVEKVIKGFLKYENVEFFADQSLQKLFQKAGRAEKRFIEMETFATTFEQFLPKPSALASTEEDEQYKTCTVAEATNVINFAHKIVGLVKEILKGY